MGQAKFFFQFANPLSLGMHGGLKRSSCANAFPPPSKRGKKCQHGTQPGRTQNHQNQGGLVLPKQELDGGDTGILKCERCCYQCKDEGKYEVGHAEKILIQRLLNPFR